MGFDRRYLEKHGNQYRVQVKVPAPLRPIVGKARLVRPLKTDSLAKAEMLKWPIVTEFKAAIQAAKLEAKSAAGSANQPLVREAYEFRAELRRAEDDPIYAQQLDDSGDLEADGPTFIRSLISDRAEEICRSVGPVEAASFAALASGKATPLLHYVDTWIAEADMKVRQQGSYRKAVSKFDAWLSREKRSPTVEAVTMKLAGSYVSQAFVAKGIHWKTTNKDVSCLSSYWRWLIKKGHAEVNPWKGQSVPKRPTPKSEAKRPFTDDEVVTLLSGGASALLIDFMKIAALSGMRLDEIARLEARDVIADAFEVRVSKTSAGERSVPIHPDLATIVTRRMEGKTGSDPLFPELPVPAPTSAVERSSPVSKAFTYYRRKIGVDDLAKGKRQSRIDFHSFRRWFITKARDALATGATGYSEWTLAEVVGHSREEMPLGMTMGRYAGASQTAAKQACVEAVKLPEGKQ